MLSSVSRYLSASPTPRGMWLLTLLFLVMTTVSVVVHLWLASLAGLVVTLVAVTALINQGGRS